MPAFQDTPDQFVVTNGARLHFLDWGGSGPPLLFLPGIGEPASVFKWFAARFIPRYRALSLTRRGTGRSQLVPGTYHLSQLVDDIRAFADGLGLGPLCAVGHSYGGLEITRLATLYPDCVRALVYLDGIYSQELLAVIREDPLSGPQVPALPAGGLDSFHDYFSYARASFPYFDKIWSLPIEEAWAADVQIDPDGKLKEIDRGTALTDMVATAAEEVLDYSAIRCPVLAIAAFESHHSNIPENAAAELREKANRHHERKEVAKRAALNALK
jgi:pimeloyl-ACP methyl ester carboxylesterase